MDVLESAKMLAVNYIDYAPRTIAEVRRRLSRAEYDEETIEVVIADLVRAELLDDSKFSADWIESRARAKKLGRTRLASELRQKGISREDTDLALQGLDAESELKAALDLARKRLSRDEIEAWSTAAERAAGKRRLAGYLQRRGYNWEIIEQVFARIAANDE
jgi:regulatory protein